jgi:hypothetical protein
MECKTEIFPVTTDFDRIDWGVNWAVTHGRFDLDLLHICPRFFAPSSERKQ